MLAFASPRVPGCIAKDDRASRDDREPPTILVAPTPQLDDVREGAERNRILTRERRQRALPKMMLQKGTDLFTRGLLGQ